MASPPPKQWGLSPPLSISLPTARENEKTADLIEELKKMNNYELGEATQKRMKTLSLLSKSTIEFVREVSRGMGHSQQQIDQYGGKIFPYGSYRLGVYGPGSDIDTLAVVPRHITREQFFQHFPSILRRIAGPDSIQSLTAVPGAFVPIIKLVLNNIEIDLIFVSVPSRDTIPKDFQLDDNKLLTGLDQQSIKSITGPRVTDQILALVPEHKTFRTALRAIKLWAQNRAIYANIVGYPGGVAWAMLVAKVCQLYPHATGSVIVNKFFHIYKAWNWPMPVMLKQIETGPEKTWNPVLYSGDKKNLLPIITPAYPSMCATYNMTQSGKTVIMREIERGARLTDNIFNGSGKWSTMFEKHTFFTEDFKYYISVVSSSASPEAAKAWSGLVESKVRILVAYLEAIKDQISLARPFTKGYSRLHKISDETEAAEVRKGSMKYKCAQVEVIENNSPDLVTNGGGATILEGGDAKSKDANYYTHTYYIGITLTAAAKKNLNISGPIGNFKETCKENWSEYESGIHFLEVQAIKAWDLPDDLFEPGEIKQPKPVKKVVKPKTGSPSQTQSEASQPASQVKPTRSFREIDDAEAPMNGTEPKRQKIDHMPSTSATPTPAPA